MFPLRRFRSVGLVAVSTFTYAALLIGAIVAVFDGSRPVGLRIFAAAVVVPLAALLLGAVLGGIQTDETGLTVHTWLGRRHVLTWSEVEAVQLRRNGNFGWYAVVVSKDAREFKTPTVTIGRRSTAQRIVDSIAALDPRRRLDRPPADSH